MNALLGITTGVSFALIPTSPVLACLLFAVSAAGLITNVRSV